jgi:hypothetical protein
MSRTRSRYLALAVLVTVWALVLWGQFKGRAEARAAAPGNGANALATEPTADAGATPAPPHAILRNRASAEMCAAQDRADKLPLGLDPFFKRAAAVPPPATPAKLPAPPAATTTKNAAPAPREPVLTSTFVQDARRSAVIDSVRLHEGDMLRDDVRLVRIGPGWVELDDSGVKRTLALPRLRKATPTVTTPAQPQERDKP